MRRASSLVPWKVINNGAPTVLAGKYSSTLRAFPATERVPVFAPFPEGKVPLYVTSSASRVPQSLGVPLGKVGSASRVAPALPAQEEQAGTRMMTICSMNRVWQIFRGIFRSHLSGVGRSLVSVV